MTDSRFSDFLMLGARTTTIKSYSALGPSFKVMRFVSSLVTGFSTYHNSYLTSLLTIESDCFLPEELTSFCLKGKSGLLNFSEMLFLLYFRFNESTESSTIYSQLVRLDTLSVDPSILPG